MNDQGGDDAAAHHSAGYEEREGGVWARELTPMGVPSLTAHTMDWSSNTVASMAKHVRRPGGTRQTSFRAERVWKTVGTIAKRTTH